MAGGKPGELLDSMANALPNHGVSVQGAVTGVRAALAMRSDTMTGTWTADDGLWAAVEGYPVWVDGDRARMAGERGHAHTLIAAYRDLGPALLEGLRGSFSLAVIDSEADRALLAVDRWGIQTLCYSGSHAGGLVFGSTTDAVRAHPDVGATIAPQTVYEFLYFVDRIPAPHTVYEEQRKLVPGECIVYDRGRIEVRPYWHMPYREQGRTDVEALSSELMTRLRAAVAGSLTGEDTASVGAFLSGGLDSSTVAGLLAEITRPGQARTFTIGFDTPGFDETPYAKIAADQFRTDHTVYYTTPDDLFSIVRDATTIYDEPFANSSNIPAYFCALRAKEAGVQVMLAGDGGDELFGGNSRYVKDGVFDHYRRLPAWLRHGLIGPVVANLPIRDRVHLFRRAANYVDYASMTVPERMTMDNIFRHLDPVQTFAPDALREIDPHRTIAFVNAIYDSTCSGSKVHRMFQFDLRITLADSDLRKVGRMCELAGVRVRYPFLDDELAEFSATIDPELLMRGGKLRWFYTHAVRDFLPQEILTKQKHGFGLPFLEYVASHGGLTDLFCDALGDLKKRPWFAASFLDSAIDTLRRADDPAIQSVAWDLVMLELWLQSRPPVQT